MKVLWLMEELGLSYERIDAGGAFGRTKEPEYRAMNPMGLVPTLQEEDGWALCGKATRSAGTCVTPKRRIARSTRGIRAKGRRWKPGWIGRLGI
jgi:glutathione S-transferase